jgi:hypothetical protein
MNYEAESRLNSESVDSLASPLTHPRPSGFAIYVAAAQHAPFAEIANGLKGRARPRLSLASCQCGSFKCNTAVRPGVELVRFFQDAQLVEAFPLIGSLLAVAIVEVFCGIRAHKYARFCR